MKKLLTILIVLCGMQALSQIPKTEWSNRWIKTPQLWADSVKVSGVWYKTFGYKGTLSIGYIPYLSATNTMSNSPLQANATGLGIGITPATYKLNVNGTLNVVNEITCSKIGSNTTPVSAFHSDWGNGVASAMQFTAGTTTGKLVSDGSHFGVDASGNTIINNKENLSMNFYTNNTLAATIQNWGGVIFAQTIAATNFETNSTSMTVRAGNSSGLNETESYGRRNVFIGHASGYTLTDQTDNVFVGYQAGYSLNSGQNTHIGSLAGKQSTGAQNVFIGYNTGNTTGSSNYNVCIGVNAGKAMGSVGENVLIGMDAGKVHAGGTTVMLGNNVAPVQTGGSGNTYLGMESGYHNVTGQANIFIGYRAGWNETGSSKLVIDNQSRTTSSSEALIYGNYSSTVNNQTLSINAGSLDLTGQVAMKYTSSTGERCLCVLVTADEAILKGQVCSYIQGGTADRVKLTPITGNENDMPVGVAYTSAAAAGSTFWMAIQGVVQVLPEAGITATQGYVLMTSTTVAGKVQQVNTPSTTALHFKECGHFTRTGTGNGALTTAIIHFN